MMQRSRAQTCISYKTEKIQKKKRGEKRELIIHSTKEPFNNSQNRHKKISLTVTLRSPILVEFYPWGQVVDRRSLGQQGHIDPPFDSRDNRPPRRVGHNIQPAN